MYTLLFDSSNTKLAVGIANKDKVLKSIIYDAWQQQSEHMIPELYNLLEEFSVQREEIESVMAAIGPGSYVGVRIALTIAKTIAMALDIPIYPVSSLQIQKTNKKPSICVINARSERSYVGVYLDDKCLLNDQIMSNEDLLKYIEEHPDYDVCGESKYLGVSGVVNNTIEEMFSLKEYLTPIKDTYGLKPVYLKD